MSRKMRMSSLLTKLMATPLRPKRPERPILRRKNHQSDIGYIMKVFYCKQ